jgi:hypothetical protein
LGICGSIQHVVIRKFWLNFSLKGSIARRNQRNSMSGGRVEIVPGLVLPAQGEPNGTGSYEAEDQQPAKPEGGVVVSHQKKAGTGTGPVPASFSFKDFG